MKNTILKIATMKTFTLFVCLCLFTFNSYAQVIFEQKNLTITQTKDSALQITLALENSNSRYQIQQLDNQLTITAPFLTESVIHHSNQKNTVIRSIDIKKNITDSTLIINTTAPIKYAAWQIDNKLTINLLSVNNWQEEPRLSIHVVNTPLRSVLKLIVDQLAVNAVIDDSVTENISLDFNNVPKNEVLPLILQAKQLADIDNEGVHLILPEQQTKKIKVISYKTLITNKDNLDPLTVDFNTSKTSNILDILSSFSDKKIITPSADLGDITITAINLSWLEVLTNVAIIKGLTITRNGDVFTLY